MSATIERLPPMPRLRPVDEPIPPHVRVAADKVVARLNAAQHPNVVKMHDAIDGWVREANVRGGQAGVDYLALASARIQRHRESLAANALDQGPLPPVLEGVTVWDLGAADGRISRAVATLNGEASS